MDIQREHKPLYMPTRLGIGLVVTMVVATAVVLLDLGVHLAVGLAGGVGYSCGDWDTRCWFRKVIMNDGEGK